MSLLNELKRRNVIRVAIAYLIVGWLLAQVSTTLESALNLPPWFDTLIVTVMLIGFPIALIIAWVYELTPDGIKKEIDIKSDDSITHETSKKLNYVTIFAAVGVLGMFIWQQLAEPTPVQQIDSMVSSSDESVVEPQQQTLEALNSQTLKSQTLNNKSIAVLPFTNMANNPDSEPITVGLHDDLLTHLSKISALKVISRTSVLEYKDTTKKIKQIAEELGVANILEGGIQKSGNQIRINMQLINAQTDVHIWAEKFDRELTAGNVFQIQTDISIKIAAALKAQLTPAEQKSVEQPDTDNLDAYSAYMAGRQLLLSRNSSDLKQALTLFQEATSIDPNYALAYVAQADTLGFLYYYSGLSHGDMLAQIKPLVAKALSLQPFLAEAHTSQAVYLENNRDYKKAEESFKYSRSLNPNYASNYHWYGLMLYRLGRFQEALDLYRKAAELDPLSPAIQSNIGWALYYTDQIEQAKAQFYRVLALAPGYTEANIGLSTINSDSNQIDEAIIWMRKAIANDPGSVNSHSRLIYLYLIIGDLTAAKNALLQAKIIAPEHEIYDSIKIEFDLYEKNYQSAIERNQLAQENQPDNNWLKDQMATLLMYQGENKKAADMWLTRYHSEDELGIALNEQNLASLDNLVWVLKESGQESKAESLASAIHSMMKNRSFKENGWLNFTLLAIQDKPKEAAINYAQYLAKDSISGWHIIDQLPYLAEMKKQPEYIEAYQQLMTKLKQQRDNLAELDSEEKSE